MTKNIVPKISSQTAYDSNRFPCDLPAMNEQYNTGGPQYQLLSQ